MLKGGCACGEIKYEINCYSQFSFHCQCRQCQRITVAGHSSQFMVSADTVNIIGNLKYYDQPTDGGNIKSSGFCGICGSPILTKSSGYPESLYFHATSLENPEQYKPSALVCNSSSQDWDYINPDIEII